MSLHSDGPDWVSSFSESLPSPGTFEAHEPCLAVRALLQVQLNGGNQRPIFRASVAIAVGAGGIAISGGRARLDIWYNADPDAAIEARIDAAEKNLSRLRDRLNEFEQETEKSLARRTKALEQEKQDRASGDKDIREKLEAAQVGGLYISMAGMWWLVAGVIMSTVPSELACLANFLLP